MRTACAARWNGGGRSAASALLAACAVISTLAAQTVEPARDSAATDSVQSLRAAFRLPVPEGWLVSRVTEPWTMPSMGANSPTAFGAAWGDLFVAASYTARARYVEASDGAVGIGFGLGDPVGEVALEIDVISFTSLRSGLFTRAGVDFLLHKMLPGGVAIGLGWESAITRGYSESSSKYVVGSKWIRLRKRDTDPFSALMISAGVGNGRFLPEDDWARGAGGVNLFGSAALRLLPPVSVIADWTGQDLTLATSVAPFRHMPIAVTLGFSDITGAAGDGARFVASAGASIRFD